MSSPGVLLSEIEGRLLRRCRIGRQNHALMQQIQQQVWTVESQAIQIAGQATLIQQQVTQIEQQSQRLEQQAAQIQDLFPSTVAPQKMVVGKLLSFWEGLFSGVF